MKEKKALLLSSSSLRWVIKNHENIIESFKVQNRNGPSLTISPAGKNYNGYFGALGYSGAKYYFVPSEHEDNYITFSKNEALNDGIGGATEGGWATFRGENSNILCKFLSFHKQHNPNTRYIESLI